MHVDRHEIDEAFAVHGRSPLETAQMLRETRLDMIASLEAECRTIVGGSRGPAAKIETAQQVSLHSEPLRIRLEFGEISDEWRRQARQADGRATIRLADGGEVQAKVEKDESRHEWHASFRDCSASARDLIDASVLFDKSWLLKAKIGILRTQLEDPSIPHNDVLALAAISDGASPAVKTLAWSLEERSSHVLNEEQQACVRRSNVHSLLLIVGPPGTGKTKTLTEIAVSHAREKQRVLIVAPSNPATDVLVRSCMSRLRDLGATGAGDVIRLGPNPSDLLTPELRDDVIQERVAAQKAAQLLKGCEQAIQGQLPPHLTWFARNIVRRDDEVGSALTAAIKPALLSAAKIVIAPAAQLYLSHKQLQGFDTVIVDEASMVDVPSIFLAAGLARQRIVIAGDPNQLSVPIETKRAGNREPVPFLRRSIFDRHRIRVDDAVTSDQCWQLLREQHRMPPAISELVGGIFYGSQLRTAGEAKRRSLPLWRLFPSAGAVVAIDTGSASLATAAKYGPHASLENARVAELLARAFAARATGVGSVLVLSPFRDQVAQLSARLQDLGSIAVKTVHRAQGDEADVVILTVDETDCLSPFAKASCLSDEGPRLLNVAISRARQRVFVVGPLSRLQRTAGAAVRGVIGQLLRAALNVDASQIV